MSGAALIEHGIEVLGLALPRSHAQPGGRVHAVSQKRARVVAIGGVVPSNEHAGVPVARTGDERGAASAFFESNGLLEVRLGAVIRAGRFEYGQVSIGGTTQVDAGHDECWPL